MGWIRLLIFVLFILSFSLSVNAKAAKIVEVEINGEINEGTVIHINHAFNIAEKENADAILVVLNTPGGLVMSTEKIVSQILNSKIPVITYVYPQGAFSASAGSFILISGNIAVMSNGTSVGAATPITSDYLGQRIENKTVNYIASYIRSIAEKRGRPIDVVEKFVTESLSLSAREAYERGVIDVLADSKDELFKKLNGWQVKLDGKNVTLHFDTIEVIRIKKPLQASIYEILSNPQVATILFLIGLYGLIFGFTSPGILPETIGAICLILSLVGLGFLSLNYVSIMLIIAGIIFLIAELLTPTYGILGAASVICVTLGAIMLFQEPLMPKEFYNTFPMLIAGISLGLAIVVTFLLIKVVQLKKVEKKVGGEAIIGEKGEVVSFENGKGFAKVRGEIWKIKSEEELEGGDEIVVVDREGLILHVKKPE
ncbi:nodulation protein NfeD [Archaeoglobales archaeon]|nr:MAG: nodulation protein NfeD [Archaeoglobales archaeon]